MLSWEEALARVLEQCRPAGEPVEIPSTEALGFALAEDVASDLDSPLATKSLVDGYAVRTADVDSGRATLDVIEEVTAGRTPSRTLGPGQATRVMTGAPIPEGADAMVMVEHTCIVQETDGSGERVEIDSAPLVPGQNILERGREMQRGQRVLETGQEIRPQEIGLLASVGRTQVRVWSRPTVGILSTGDELVEPTSSPAVGQIRNSNGPMLSALVTRAGGQPRSLGIARDNAEALRERIGAALECDVVLISGGVSMGKLDLVPGVLAKLGVEQVFHKVALRPGKPLWFGVASDKAPTLVFGLPGNPVSGFVCFELFVRPAIRRLGGFRRAGLPRQSARLNQSWKHRGQRATFWPARLVQDTIGVVVSPLPWSGSADLRTITTANCFVCLPEGDRDYQPGDVVETVGW